MLKADGITKFYGEKQILKEISFHVREQELVSIMGASGEGKSTISRILCGTVKPDAGRVFFRDQVLTGEHITYKKNFRKSIQLVPQQPFAALDPRQTVINAVMEPLLYHKLVSDRRAARQRAEELLERVLLSHSLFERRPSELSGGQAQRVLIARSLTVSPEFIIADEATSMLDISSQSQIIKIFQELIQKEKISILFISHDFPLVKQISDRIYYLQDGRLSE